MPNSRCMVIYENLSQIVTEISAVTFNNSYFDNYYLLKSNRFENLYDKLSNKTCCLSRFVNGTLYKKSISHIIYPTITPLFSFN